MSRPARLAVFLARLPLLALFFGTTLSARSEPSGLLAPDHDGTLITADTSLAAGTWVVADRGNHGVIRIATDGVTLDLGGATLRGAPEDAAPDTLSGVGIVVEKAKGVTIRGGRIAGFKVGIRAVDAPGLLVEEVDASGNFRQRLGSTPEREDPADWLWPHENDAGEWEAKYGAGISLTACPEAEVRFCVVRHGQNGLLLTRCAGASAWKNDFSFDSGWGIALYRSTRCEIAHNRLDFCVRGYSHGVYHRGQDSAAILVFEQSSDNLFLGNSATHSGDGFFLYAGHETTRRTGKGGSNGNHVVENDFRFAVANGIEATFSEGNVFRWNDCSGSDYGIWGGYSYRSSFLGNVAHDCLTAGIAIEHGHDNRILSNRVTGAPVGIHLWWDEDPDLRGGVYGKVQDTDSARNVVYGNDLSATDAALRFDGDLDGVVQHNDFPGPRTRLRFGKGSRLRRLAGNTFAGDLVVENRSGSVIEVRESERPPGSFASEGDPVTWIPGPPAPPKGRVVRRPLHGQPPPPPSATDPGFPHLPPDFPAGRASIRIDEWGPVDPRETRLFPARQSAPGPEARVHLLGTGPFRVLSSTDGVTAEPREGTAPATIVVRSAGEGPALRPFGIAVEAGGKRHLATGTVQRIPWEVRWFAWADAEDPRVRPEAFARLLSGGPVRRDTFDALDFPWRGGGPEGVPADRFATLATSEVDLPAGRYAVRVVSDDGVRVFVDGVKVIERWDRHGPTEDLAEVDLAAGRHALRVEHFEIDGWSFLSLRLEPLPAGR